MTATTKEYLPELGVWKTVSTSGKSTILKITMLSLDKEGFILHSVNDEPAYVEEAVTSSGEPLVFRQWSNLGFLHRDGDLPAEIQSDGTLHYYKNGVIHRDGGLPAIVGYSYAYVGDDHTYPSDAYFIWCQNGNYGRAEGDHGPTCIDVKGTKEWYRGLYGGDVIMHNEHGPAVIGLDGTRTFFLNDVELTEDQFNHFTSKV